MARKPIEIERDRCGHLWGSVLRRCAELDVAARCTPTKRGVALLQGDAKKVARDVIAQEVDAMIELYGEIRADREELAALDYLDGFAWETSHMARRNTARRQMARPISFAEAKRWYVHRYTMEHVPAWAMEQAPNGKYYAPQYRSDAEWYEHTMFPGEGHLSSRTKRCYSSGQTWPLGMWLDEPYDPRGRRNSGGMSIAANELKLYIDNNRQLYHQQHEPIVKNLMTKIGRGTYDSAKSVKLWGYLCESGAKKYAKEFGGTWHQMFTVADRKQCAEALRDDFEAEVGTGAFDEYIPKKYRARANPSRANAVKVVFRAWRGGYASDNVIALFPDLEESPGFCMSYMHIGQHGAADYSYVIANSRPAKPAEYAMLKGELEDIGYVLRVAKRA